MDELFLRLQRWFEAHAPDATPRFDPGTPDADGILAPLFRATGGQTGGEAVFHHHVLLSPEDARREKEMMDRLAVTEAWDTDWWDPGWYPFASDCAGQLLVVDERDGRVISFVHDDHPRKVLADSLQAFVEGLVDHLESGALVCDPVVGIQRPEDIAAWRASVDEAARNQPLSTPKLLVLALALSAAFVLLARALGL